MSLEFTFSHPVDDVFDLLCDPDFLVERSIALGEISADAEIEDDGTQVTIKMRREVTRDLPKILAKVFDPKQVLSMTEEWKQIGEAFIGTAVFLVEGQPVEIKMDMTLKPTEGGCIYTCAYKAKAKIPLVGGKVEKYIISNCVEGTQKECEFAEAKLAA
ncbi:MAG: DUF2505 domain-containing protein [Pseudomonadales bacterium]|nr:DUF2505 domain-containing protein [Pseudomonadales bacterium]